MAKLSTTSPICIRIVIAFLQFLSFVEGVTETENEYLKDLEHALKEIFRISDSDVESKNPEISLLNMFSPRKTKPQVDETASTRTTAAADKPVSSSTGPAIKIDVPSTQLFHEFFVRLTECRFFDFIFGENYQARRTRAKNIFKAALELLMEAGTHTFTLDTLANALQTLGRKAFDLKFYYKSVEFCSCAIALFKDNAEYFCDRASALMMIERYEEAMNDCYRALRLKPKYLRAYFGIGCIYLKQGKSIEAICHGFLKVLQIDPYNTDGVEELELAEEELKQQLNWIGEQLQFLKGSDIIPGSREEEQQHKAEQQGTVLESEAAALEEDGGSDPSKLSPTCKVDENKKDANNGDTDTVADFVDLFARYAFPPESEADALFI